MKIPYWITTLYVIVPLAPPGTDPRFTVMLDPMRVTSSPSAASVLPVPLTITPSSLNEVFGGAENAINEFAAGPFPLFVYVIV
jgi:hypothetical protein